MQRVNKEIIQFSESLKASDSNKVFYFYAKYYLFLIYKNLNLDFFGVFHSQKAKLAAQLSVREYTMGDMDNKN